jgi:hypothetical protein
MIVIKEKMKEEEEEIIIEILLHLNGLKILVVKEVEEEGI